MLPILLFNVIAGLVVDKAQDLAVEHVESMIDDLLPDTAKKELDKVIKADHTHEYTNAKDALIAVVDGKLPIVNIDGSLKPIEVTFTVKFDPNTKDISIDQA